MAQRKGFEILEETIKAGATLLSWRNVLYVIILKGKCKCWIMLQTWEFVTLSWAFHGSSPSTVNQESVVFYNNILSGQIAEQATLSLTLGESVSLCGIHLVLNDSKFQTEGIQESPN